MKARAVVDLLSSRDQVAVVGFDSQPYVISEMRPATDAESIKESIGSLAAGGGTFMYPTMAAGSDMLRDTVAKIQHMIVLSDGQTQPADHESLVRGMVDKRITASTVALGQADRQLLARIAELGKGRYYETDSPENVPQIFTKETMEASRSAIKEDVFGTVQTSDHPILAGYASTELPFTFGYVMTQAKPTAQVLLVTESGDPLMAVSRYGLGTGLAYTSDLTERWGGQWLAWEGCGRFWAQALRGLVRHRDVEGLHVVGNAAKDAWRLSIERVDGRGGPVDGVQWDADVLSADGRTEPIDVEQVGVGTYEAQVPLRDRRRLTVRLPDRDYDKMKVLHYHAPYPAEYRLTRTVPEPLKHVAAVDPCSIRAQLPPQRRRRLVQDWTCYAALACLLAGVFLRRV